MTAQIYSNKEIAELIAKFNACYPVPVQWTYKRAIKDHTDLFDKKIREGEPYYRLSMGGGRHHDVNKAIDDQFEQVRRIMDNLRPQ